MIPKKSNDHFNAGTAGFYTLYGKLVMLLFTALLATLSAAAQCNQYTTLSAGAAYSMGIKADGTLWAWGFNSNGQLGDGTTTTRTTPVQIGTDTWNAVSAGTRHTIAIKSDGTLWGWGFNDRGQIDGSTTTTILSPKRIGFASNWWNAQISAGSDYTLMVNSGTLYAWGSNGSAFGYGRLGNGGNGNYNVPTVISYNWRTVSAHTNHSLGVKTDGTLWAWGDNFYGQLGLGTTGGADVLAPIQVGTANNWRSVAAGSYSSMALTSSGGLWGWGRNNQGNLGDGTTVDKNAPIPIGNTSWSEITVKGGDGGNFVVGKQSNGTIWSWGGSGVALGIGASDGNRHTPTQIGTAADWGKIVAGGTHVLAIKAINGALWAWGVGREGQLGNNSTGNQPSPVEIGVGGGYSNIARVGTQTGMVVNTGANQVVYNCGLVASITPNGANPVSGYTSAKVWIEGTQPAQYVKRHYEITPNTNAATATGRVTLYFTQQEFNDFNYVTSNTLKLPTFSTDPRKTNVRIEKRGGTSNSYTGLPDTYTGTVETIDPVDTDIVWNSTLNVWEVSFNVTGFSGFFVKTQETALPVSFGNVAAKIKNGQLLVNWETLSETNNSHFNIEVSTNGTDFTSISTLPSKAVAGNSSITMDYEYSISLTAVARLGIAAMVCLLCIGYTPRRLRWAPVLFIVIASSLFFACNKTATDVDIKENKQLFVRIMQVDQDGKNTYSKVVQALSE